MSVDSILHECYQVKLFLDRCSRRNRDIYEVFTRAGFDLAKSVDSLSYSQRNTLLNSINQNDQQINRNSRFLSYLSNKLPEEFLADKPSYDFHNTFFHIDQTVLNSIISWAQNNINLSDFEHWLTLPVSQTMERKSAPVPPTHINNIRSIAEITDILNGKFSPPGTESKDSPNSSPPLPRNRHAGVSMRRVN